MESAEKAVLGNTSNTSTVIAGQEGPNPIIEDTCYLTTGTAPIPS
jgi:hypothetical protein